MSFRTKSRDKIVSAFSKIFKRDTNKSNEQFEDQKDGKTNNNHDKNNNKHAFQKDIVSAISAVPTGGNASSKSIYKTVQAKRLMKELSDIERDTGSTHLFTVDLVNERLDEWNIKLYPASIDSSSDLYADMKSLNVPYILLQIQFPPDFPFYPPFLRVVSPTIEKGFVMQGGAICLELLTPRGWSSAYSIESVIMQFAASVVKGHGRISKTLNKSKSFNKKSAEEAFRNLVRTHDKYGWVTPPLAEG